jgi:hypothetical protein
MRLLRRAPREVYRVYGEAEFFADAGPAAHPEPEADGVSERWLRRVIGTTLLLAAAGAVGGVVASAGTPSAPSARRGIRSSLVAAAGSLVAGARIHLVAGARVHVTRGRPVSRARADRGGEGDLSARVHRGASAGERGGDERGGGEHVLGLARAAKIESAPIRAALPMSAARTAVAGPAVPRQLGRSEFGFER